MELKGKKAVIVCDGYPHDDYISDYEDETCTICSEPIVSGWFFNTIKCVVLFDDGKLVTVESRNLKIVCEEGS